MILDVRTMYIAMAAVCFVVAVALLTLQAQRFRRDGVLLWALGLALQGVFWVLLGLRGTVGDFLSIVVANTFLTASYSLLYAAVRQFQGRSHNAGILLFPAAATFAFVWCFSVYVDSLLSRITFMSLLSFVQTSGIALALLRHAPAKERRAYWLTGFAFLVMAVGILVRLIEALTPPYGQPFIVQATISRNPSVLVAIVVVVLSSIGFVLMIRERAEEALQKSESRYRALVEHMPDVIASFDRDCRYQFVNSAIAEVSKAKPEDFIGRVLGEVEGFTEEQIAFRTQVVRDVFQTRTPYESEFEVQGPNGNLAFEWRVYPVVDADHNVSSVFSINRNITERKHAEEALRKSEESYRLLAEKVNDVIWTVDMGLKLTYISPSVRESRGYTVEEAIAQTLPEILSPESLAVVRRIFAEELRQ